jgi:hypothetical protein
MIKLIENTFIEVISKKFQNESVRSYLLTHPMRFVMFDNLQKEIKDAGCVLDEMTGDLEKKRRAIHSLVESLTLLFAKIALQMKEKDLKNANEERDESENSFLQY